MWTYRVDDIESMLDGYEVPIDCPVKTRTVYVLVDPHGDIRGYFESREEARDECRQRNNG